ncbi:MAG: Na+/H+ antiporter subunit E [Caldilineaceae bacterium]|nr:Na+/H+ antiporter subunit E [Caldilineaceae bacterium]
MTPQPTDAPQDAPEAQSKTDYASRYFILLLNNLLIALLWQAQLPIFGALDYFLGFAAGLLFLTLVESSYSRQTWRVVAFIFYAVWQIIVSSADVTWTVLQSKERMKPRVESGVVAVPLTVTGNIEIAVLATMINLTPGTLSLDLSPDRSVLYVHGLDINDPEEFRRQIKDGFEHRLLQITRGIA